MATTIDTLPEDMIVEIAAQLVACSPLPFTDLMSFEKSCKMFFEAATDRLVKQRIVLEREFPDLNWKSSDWRMAIFKACANAGNPEACLFVALVNIFGDRDISRGVELLHKAASNGDTRSLCLMNILKMRVREHPPVANMLPPDTFRGIESIKLDEDDVRRCREWVAFVHDQVMWNNMRASNRSRPGCESFECRFGGWYYCDRHVPFCNEACRWNQKFLELCLKM